MKNSPAPKEMKMEEYICFLYMAIADADMHIAAQEIEALKVGLEKLKARYYPQSTEVLDSLVQTIQGYIRTQSEEEKRAIIARLSSKYPLSVDMKIDIISDIHELIHVDEFVAMSEYNMLNYIRLCLIGA